MFNLNRINSRKNRNLNFKKTVKPLIILAERL